MVLSRMGGTVGLMAGVGGGVPAMGRAPLSLFSGAGGSFLAHLSPRSRRWGAS